MMTINENDISIEEQLREKMIQDEGIDLFNRTSRREYSQEYTDFYGDLVTIINEYNQVRHSNTPSYIIANYLLACLEAFEYAVNKRDMYWEHFPDIMSDDNGL